MRGWTRAGRGVALLALVLALLGLAPRPVQARQRAFARPPALQTCLARRHVACLAPAQVYAAYGISPLLRRGIDGRGRTIAVVVSFGSPTLRADLSAFDRAFGLPDPQITILAPLGERHPERTGWIAETTLDVEWSHAIAPRARIVVLESPVDETEGVQGLPEFLSLERYALKHRLADVISQSWGATEDTLFDTPGRRTIAAMHQLYVDAAAQGVTVVGASGDLGAAGFDSSVTHILPQRVVGYPASDPLVLSVGGSALALAPDGRVRSETAWPRSGGGLSKLFAEPAYQRLLPGGVQHLLAGHRGVPDVAYNAGQKSWFLGYLRGRWQFFGGTSAGAPQWAGIVALADQAAGRDLGPINAALYRLAASPRYGADLRDITTGGIIGPIQAGARLGGVAYRAAPGWDPATGLGTPHAAALIPDLIRLLSSGGAP